VPGRTERFTSSEHVYDHRPGGSEPKRLAALLSYGALPLP
jgi:hypothetical protein